MEQGERVVLLLESDVVTEGLVRSLFKSFYPKIKLLHAEHTDQARKLLGEAGKSLVAIIIDDFQQNLFILKSFIIDVRLNRNFTGDLVAFSTSPHRLVQLGCNKILPKPCGVRDLDLLFAKWR